MCVSNCVFILQSGPLSPPTSWPQVSDAFMSSLHGPFLKITRQQRESPYSLANQARCQNIFPPKKLLIRKWQAGGANFNPFQNELHYSNLADS